MDLNLAYNILSNALNDACINDPDESTVPNVDKESLRTVLEEIEKYDKQQ